MQSALDAMQDDLNTRMLKRGASDFEALHWDFTRLFIGPESPPAPPWESVYVSRDKLLFQESTLNVKTFYQQNGFHLPETEYEAADHIGYELDFLWKLSEQASQELDRNRQCVSASLRRWPFPLTLCRHICWRLSRRSAVN